MLRFDLFSCKIFAVLPTICCRAEEIFVPSESFGKVVSNVDELWMGICQFLDRHSPRGLTALAHMHRSWPGGRPALGRPFDFHWDFLLPSLVMRCPVLSLLLRGGMEAKGSKPR